jgi:hypothetical protein
MLLFDRVFREELDMVQRAGTRTAPQRAELQSTIPADNRRENVVRAKPARVIFGRTDPTKREIRERAYYIYLARGGVNGNPVSDWLRAERELRQELRRSAAPRRF